MKSKNVRTFSELIIFKLIFSIQENTCFNPFTLFTNIHSHQLVSVAQLGVHPLHPRSH